MLNPLAPATRLITPIAGHFRAFAWGTLAYNLLVIVWGALVRATSSGAGCGSHWPDCNGEILPRDPSVETAIELTHRATSGLALIAVLLLYLAARTRFDRRHPARTSAGWAMIFMLLEAALGAGIVLLELVGANASLARAGWVGLHLLNTFLLVASITSCAHFAQYDPQKAPTLHLPGVRTWLALGALGLLVTSVAGAITALGDTLFPAASLVEGFRADRDAAAHLFVRLRIVHPLLAIFVALFVIVSANAIESERPSESARGWVRVLTAMFLVQLGVGLLNVAWLAPVWMQLVHLLLADIVWISFILFSATVLGSPPLRATRSEAVRTSS